jgi:protein kinase D
MWDKSVCRSESAVGKKMEGPEVTFIFQFGLVRDTVTAAASSLGLKTLKDLACDFINRKVGTASIPKLKTDRVLACNYLDRKVGTAIKV